MHRRTFLKLCGLAAYGAGFGFGTTGCATPPKDINWSEVPDKEFSLDKFDDWFETHKLYNEINPNLKFSQRGFLGTFKASIISGSLRSSLATPGIDYSSNNMYAAADGVVIEIDDLAKKNYGRKEGLYVQIRHRDLKIKEEYKSTSFTEIGNPSRYGEFFVTHYAHLQEVELEVGQKVKRGDFIGSAAYPELRIAKIMLTNRSANYVDPDNYGPNHSYMAYWDGHTNSSNDNINERNKTQKEIWKRVCNYLDPKIGITEGVLTQKRHRPAFQSKTCYWDNITIWKYLDELYKARSSLFLNLLDDRFAEMQKEFYANQPIVLTLPLKA